MSQEWVMADSLIAASPRDESAAAALNTAMASAWPVNSSHTVTWASIKVATDRDRGVAGNRTEGSAHRGPPRPRLRRDSRRPAVRSGFLTRSVPGEEGFDAGTDRRRDRLDRVGGVQHQEALRLCRGKLEIARTHPRVKLFLLGLET